MHIIPEDTKVITIGDREADIFGYYGRVKKWVLCLLFVIDKIENLFLQREEKHKQLIQKRKDIIREIENHTNTDDKFSELLINLVELASRVFASFKGSTIERKRKLINLVFGNLKLKDRKLDFMLRPPFNAFVKCTKIE